MAERDAEVDETSLKSVQPSKCSQLCVYVPDGAGRARQDSHEASKNVHVFLMHEHLILFTVEDSCVNADAVGEEAEHEQKDISQINLQQEMYFKHHKAELSQESL